VTQIPAQPDIKLPNESKSFSNEKYRLGVKRIGEKTEEYTLLELLLYDLKSTKRSFNGN